MPVVRDGLLIGEKAAEEDEQDEEGIDASAENPENMVPTKVCVCLCVFVCAYVSLFVGCVQRCV